MDSRLSADDRKKYDARSLLSMLGELELLVSFDRKVNEMQGECVKRSLTLLCGQARNENLCENEVSSRLFRLAADIKVLSSAF